MRRYRVWAGSPKGTPEDPRRCVASVAEGDRSVLSRQCGRKRRHGGLLCMQHAKIKAEGRHLWIPRDES